MIDLSKNTLAFMRARREMCGTMRSCTECPLDELQNCKTETLDGNDQNDKKVLECVKEWRKEHPGKTYKEDLLEKFPNATIRNEWGVFEICRNKIYGELVFKTNCEECWYEEKE